MAVRARRFGNGAAWAVLIACLLAYAAPAWGVASEKGLTGLFGRDLFRRITVNGNPIPVEILQASTILRASSLSAFHGTPGDNAVVKLVGEAEEREIARELMIQDAVRRKIVLPEPEFRKLLDGEMERFGGKDRFLSFLRKNGVDGEVYERLMMRRFQAERYVSEAAARGAAVSEQEVRDGYAARRWDFESPEAIRFRSVTFRLIDRPFSPDERSALERIRRSFDSEEEFVRERDSLVRLLIGKAVVELYDDMDWDERRGGGLWKNLSSIDAGTVGVYENRASRIYFVYFVKEKIPRVRKMSEEESLRGVRDALRSERIGRLIDERIRELRGSATIQIREPEGDGR